MKSITQAVKSHRDIDEQFHLICLDGSLSLVRVAGSYLHCKEGVPIYLFFVTDEKRGVVPFGVRPEHFTLRFHVESGLFMEANLQGRIAFLVHDFSTMYEAITVFATHYVHPQDRKVFAPFIDQHLFQSHCASSKECKDIPFRRTSYNEAFTGYRWSLLSYRVEADASGSLCELSICESDRLNEQLAEKTLLSQRDALTGVLHRTAFEAEVTSQISFCGEKPCFGAFFMLDIDQFKMINDSYGHDYGDQVLCQVASTIKGVFRPTDIVSRTGGDEFAIFITGIPSYEVAAQKAEKLCHLFRSLTHDGKDMQLSCSVGVAIYPDHGTTFAELYHHSDLALYQAKQEGKNRYCLYKAHTLSRRGTKSVDIQWLFSHMEEEVYLCNMDTYELLFISTALRSRLGLTELQSRGRCFEVLHKKQSPCKECRNLSLQVGMSSTLLGVEKGTNTLYLIRERALLLQGERVKLGILTPMPQKWKEFFQQYIPIALLATIPRSNH